MKRISSRLFFLAIFGVSAVTAAARNNDNDTVNTIHWSPAHRLGWDDFKGGIPNAAPPYVAAITDCGIGYDAETVGNSDNVAVVTKNYFDTMRSWGRSEHKTPEVLAHEQGHFDLCELYTRKLRQAYSRLHITRQNMRNIIDKVYYSVTAAYTDRQEQYETETAHGNNAAAMKHWQAMIAQELVALTPWASN